MTTSRSAEQQQSDRRFIARGRNHYQLANLLRRKTCFRFGTGGIPGGDLRTGLRQQFLEVVVHLGKSGVAQEFGR